jgi:hypothetical protein
VQVRVIQARDHAATGKTDYFCVWTMFIFFGIVHAHDAPVFDRDVAGFGIFRIKCGDASVVEDEVGCLFGVHGLPWLEAKGYPG